MKDPHVEVLNYEFVSLDEDRHDFSRAPAWQGTLGEFDCHLAGGQLEARPGGHYSDIERARDALEPDLRAWELWSELKRSVRIRFTLRSARVVDRQTGAANQQVMVETAIGIGEALQISVGHGSYPPPAPKNLSVSPLVEELMGWVRDLRAGRLPMLVLAYLFLSRLEFEYLTHPGKTKLDKIARALNVSNPVLRKLGELSTKNDPAERRKVTGPPDPLTGGERQWILAVLPKLTQQVAEVDAGSSPPQLRMNDPDLPPL